jgi:hypothetical protein
VGSGGFLVAWATIYIIRWNGMYVCMYVCVLVLLNDNLLLPHKLQHKLEGTKEKRA